MTDEQDPFAFLGEAIAPTDARSMIPDHVLDIFPDDVSEHQAAVAYAYDIISSFNRPKTMATVRRKLIAANKFLLRLSEIDAAVFDEVMCAYAERALIFEQPNAA